MAVKRLLPNLGYNHSSITITANGRESTDSPKKIELPRRGALSLVRGWFEAFSVGVGNAGKERTNTNCQSGQCCDELFVTVG